MISPFISGYNLVENPLIFTTKTIDSVLCDNEHKMNGKDQEMKWDRLYSTQLLGLRDRTYEQQKNSDS